MRRVRGKIVADQSAPTPPSQLSVPLDDASVRLAMIQALIPLGLRSVEDQLQQDVAALAGQRDVRDDAPAIRWGRQRGSICLADQKVPMTVPRVRDVATHREVALPTYVALQTPKARDTALLRRVLAGS